jgi:outer membrane lipoprotein-sorting protein
MKSAGSSCGLVLFSLMVAVFITIDASTAQGRMLFRPRAILAQANPQSSGAQWNKNLESVLTLMDDTAPKLRTVQANFEWDVYTKVLDEITDTQKGMIYFRRSGKEMEMAADVSEPKESAKYLVVSNGKAEVYEPGINRIDAYDVSKHRELFESFLLLGFGGGGHSMAKSFTLKYLGRETLNGVDTAKLELIPRAEEVRNNFNRILLWINSDGISAQQQLFSGDDYRLSKYSNIQRNQKISDAVFKLKTNAKTEMITH